MLGYHFLGAFHIWLDSFFIPIGIILALILSRGAEENRKQKRTVAVIGFVFYLILQIFY